MSAPATLGGASGGPFTGPSSTPPEDQPRHSSSSPLSSVAAISEPMNTSLDDAASGAAPAAPVSAQLQDLAAAASLHPYHDARALVRLLQCPVCSLPLRRSPVTLPCGNTCCRQCLPPPHAREHISFALGNRRQGITCPFPECGKDHSLQDCSTNVVLYRILDSVEEQTTLFKSKRDSLEGSLRRVTLEATVPAYIASDEISAGTSQAVDEKADEKMALSEKPPLPAVATSSGGRFLATFDFAASGQLPYSSDVIYTPEVEDDVAEKDEIVMDEEFFSSLKNATAKEMDCNVCYHTMLEPTTTPCGHTFCKKCLARVLDYSSLCPECRRELFLPSSLSRQPQNKYLLNLMKSFVPEQMAARAQALALEESTTADGLDTPLFPCTVAFPGLRTFLHIFEPRYRLMIRRCIEGNKRFGMLVYNRFLDPQGELGRTQFMQIGTMLHIEQYSLLEDGRSVIECRGLHRFRVREHSILDGYIIGRVEKIDDISLAEEEALEAQETTQPPAAEDDVSGMIARMSTAQLVNMVRGFITNARQSSSRWVHNRLVETYGEPPESAAQLPYWLAAVLPLMDEEKYKMLPTTSIRERLKLTVRWISRIESQRW